MSLFSTFFDGLFSSSSNNTTDCPTINPASGLPMMNCSTDIEGNPYGTDLSDDYSVSTDSLFDDNIHSSSAFDNDDWSNLDTN
jgi:hypothetical protein